jgi:uncharacterized protein (TIGR00369 family)
MSRFEPRDPDYEAKVRASFARQRVMALIGAKLRRIEPGLVEIELPYREDLTQQHGFVHAGITATIADSAGGYASFSLMPPGSAILSVEYKVNLLAPAAGELFIGRGRVVRPGRRITTTEIEVEAIRGGEAKLVLFGLQTTMCLPETPDLPAG